MKSHPQHIIHAKHDLLVGKQNGLFIGVCLGCGQFLGAAKRLRLLVIADRSHVCLFPFHLASLANGH